MTDPRGAADAGHPASCPWCGQQRIHGVCPSPNGDRHYRCVACATTFFIHEPQRADDRLVLPPAAPAAKPRRRFLSRYAHKS